MPLTAQIEQQPFHEYRYLIEVDVSSSTRTKDVCLERVEGGRFVVKIAAY
jgi:hypothetical protein